jgi:methionyl-tRNA formyltransferase
VSALRYAFLVLEEHPYGREMLRALLAAELLPLAVIEERSAVAAEERLKFEERMAGFELAPTITELLLEHPGVQRIVVPHHNQDACAEALRALEPELLVLGGTRILRKHIFALAKHTLNAHPGLLPELRGSASVAWAIATDQKVGCTCHFIDAGIDTGPIISRREIPVHRGDTYERLCWATARLSAELMTEAVRAYADKTIESHPQAAGGVTYKNMPAEQVEQVKQKLAQGRYAQLVDCQRSDTPAACD